MISRSSSALRAAIGLALFASLVALYLANRRPLPFAAAGDTLPSRLIPFSILRFGTVTLEPFRGSFTRAGGYRWYVQERRDTLVSFYPIGSALVALPFYVPIYARLAWQGRTSPDELFAAAPGADKLVAALLTATSALLVWRILLARVRISVATAIAAILGSCTLYWPVASQTLWQHTALVFLLPLLVLILETPRTARQAALAGLLASLMFAVRPTAILFAAAAAVSLFWRRTGENDEITGASAVAVLVCAFAPLCALVLAYDVYFYDSLLGGYSLARTLLRNPDPLRGAVGLLLSPNRGLLAQSPITLAGVLGAAVLARRGRDEPVMVPLLVAGVLHFLIAASTTTWAGGWAFGARYATELLPLLAVAASALLAGAPRWTLAPIVPAVVVSLLVQASGAFFFPVSNWSARMEPDLEGHAWDWQHIEVWEDFDAWRHGAVPPY